jgi:hypothetical protein
MTSRAELAEVVAKAARDASAYPDLTFRYTRGHELSGITRFELQPGGPFVLRSTEARTQRTVTFEGELQASQRAELLRAADASRLLEVQSSSRRIGDDEVPVLVELRYGDAAVELKIWAGDAASNESFHAFEHSLWALLEDLSQGVIQEPPAVARGTN